jgi:nicotinamide phosphoribosyltransferase
MSGLELTTPVEHNDPTTIATNSHMARTIINQFLEDTGDPTLVDFKLHDFGYRGVTSDEQAGIGGMAHLTSFMGTDTVKGIITAQEYYHAHMCGFSIPASEHSTMTSWGKDHELDAFRNMLEQHPTGLLACVSDSFDIYHACEQYWGTDLKDQILNRDGTLVVRPDSGDPVEVTLKVFEILWKQFGGTTNEKGYRVLDPHIRMIQGDGIDLNMLTDILANFMAKKISADNIAFGSGGGLLQQFNRDTGQFAFKCCHVIVGGEGRDIFKSPIAGSKPSKKGYLTLTTNDDGAHETVNDKVLHYSDENLLELVYEDGELLIDQTFDEIKTRILV